MKRTNALKRTLQAVSVVYNDGERVPVEFDKPSRAKPDGTVCVSPNVREELGRNISGPQELRCIANTLSHEIEHIRQSDLTSKEEFMDEWPERRQLAGAVINILEDQYIDYERTQRFPGLRKAQAFVIDTLMENHHRRPRVDNIDAPVKQYRETLTQIAFAGYAKGISEADDDLREYAGRVWPLIKAVRRESDQEARKEIAHEVMEITVEYLPDDTDVDMPDTCVVCEENPPAVIVPLIGPVCDQCAPSGHGSGDGEGSGERERDGGSRQVPRPPTPGEGDGGGPGGGDGDDADGESGGGEQPGEGGGGEQPPEPDDDADGEPGGGGGGEPGGGGGGEPDFPGDDDPGGGDGPGGGEPDGDADGEPGGGGGGGGEPEFGGDEPDFPGDDDPGAQQGDADGSEREIDPREWDWLDLGGHEGHTVSIVDDDAEV